MFYVEEFLEDMYRVNNIFNEIHMKLSRTKCIPFHQIQILDVQKVLLPVFLMKFEVCLSFITSYNL